MCLYGRIVFVNRFLIRKDLGGSSQIGYTEDPHRPLLSVRLDDHLDGVLGVSDKLETQARLGKT